MVLIPLSPGNQVLRSCVSTPIECDDGSFRVTRVRACDDAEVATFAGCTDVGLPYRTASVVSRAERCRIDPSKLLMQQLFI